MQTNIVEINIAQKWGKKLVLFFQIAWPCPFKKGFCLHKSKSYYSSPSIKNSSISKGTFDTYANVSIRHEKGVRI